MPTVGTLIEDGGDGSIVNGAGDSACEAGGDGEGPGASAACGSGDAFVGALVLSPDGEPGEAVAMAGGTEPNPLESASGGAAVAE